MSLTGYGSAFEHVVTLSTARLICRHTRRELPKGELDEVLVAYHTETISTGTLFRYLVLRYVCGNYVLCSALADVDEWRQYFDVDPRQHGTNVLRHWVPRIQALMARAVPAPGQRA